MLKILQAFLNLFKANAPAAPVEPAVTPPQDPVVLAGQKAAAEAERFWQMDVYDPKIGDKGPRTPFCLQMITDIITRTNWGWALPGGKYLGDGPPQWCGLFAAWCWLVAGLDPHWVATFWASTIRFECWSTGTPWKPDPKSKPIPAGGPRPHIKLNSKSKPEDCKFPDGSLPRAGDIVVVGDETPKEGDHICVVISYDPVTGVFTTISGNGGGVGPHGDKRQGISKADYKIGQPGYHPLRVHRPLASDLIAK